MKTPFEPAAGGFFLETGISNTEFMNENSNCDAQINEIGGKLGNELNVKLKSIKAPGKYDI